MRSISLHVELTDDELLVLAGAIIVAKQATFGHALSKEAMLIVNDNHEHLNSASIKFAKAIRTYKMGEMGT